MKQDRMLMVTMCRGERVMVLVMVLQIVVVIERMVQLRNMWKDINFNFTISQIVD